jgi:hypothetical protein
MNAFFLYDFGSSGADSDDSCKADSVCLIE